jgi:serine protease Do
VNIQGEIVGINTAIFSRTGGYQGIGFAVPSNMVRQVIEQLKKGSKVTRGWIGVTIQELTPELSQKFGLKATEGVLVSDVLRGGPAAKAGIQRGDIILELDGKKVKDVGTLRNTIAQSRVGSQVNAKVLRGETVMTIPVTIAELPSDISEVVPSLNQGQESQGNALSGVTLVDLNLAIGKQLGLDREEKGVVVVRVEAGSPAEESGIRKGDVIQEIDRKRVTNLNDFNRVVSKIGRGDTVLVFINRNNKKFYVTLSP